MYANEKYYKNVLAVWKIVYLKKLYEISVQNIILFQI